MKEQILAIAGRPGLFRLVSRGSNTLILETLDEQKRRFPAGLRDRITALSDVSMYTDEEDTPLMNVFDSFNGITYWFRPATKISLSRKRPLKQQRRRKKLESPFNAGRMVAQRHPDRC